MIISVLGMLRHFKAFMVFCLKYQILLCILLIISPEDATKMQGISVSEREENLSDEKEQ